MKSADVSSVQLDTLCFIKLPLTSLCRRSHRSGLFERGPKGAAAVVGTGMPVNSVLKGCKIQQTVKSCFLEIGTMMNDDDTAQPLHVFTYSNFLSA